MSHPFYYLKVETEPGCGCIIGPNGSPLASDHEGLGLRKEIPINEFLVNGENFLAGDLFWPPTKDFVPGQSKVRALIYEADPSSQKPKIGKILAEYLYPDPEDETDSPVEEAPLEPAPSDENTETLEDTKSGPTTKERYPQVFKIKLDLPQQDFFSNMDFEPVPKLSEQDKTEIKGHIEGFIDALVSRDFDKCWEYTRRKYQNIAQANDFPLESVKKSLQRQLNTLERMGPNLEVDFRKDQLAARPCFDKKVFWLSGLPKHQGTFRISTAGEPGSMIVNVYVGKGQEGWQIFQ